MIKFHSSILDKLNLLSSQNSFWPSLIFTIAGSCFALFFASKSDFKKILFQFNKVEITQGTVLKIYETNCSENDETIWAFDFSYEIDKKEYLSVSYSKDHDYKTSEEVEIIYLTKDPTIAKITGTRSAPYSLYSSLFTLIFPILGLIGILETLKNTFRISNILKNGQITNAELISRIAPTKKNKNKSKHHLKYEYVTNSGSYVHTLKTEEPNKYDFAQPLIYSSLEPAKSVLIKTLPIGIKEKIKY